MRKERCLQLEHNYKKGLIFSIFIHACLMLFLLVSLEKGVRPTALSKPSGEIVQATVVEETHVEEELHRLAAIEKQKQQAVVQKIQRQKEIAKLKQQEEDKLAEIKLAKEKEKKQLEALKQEQEKEKQRLATLEEKRKKEEAQVAKKKAQQAEAKKKALAAKKSAEEAKKAAVANAESDAAAAENAKWMSTEIEKYDAMMRQKINQYWTRPPGLQAGLACELYARLLPDGSVMDPQVKKSSGNVAFDQAAIAALQNASPLPVPNEPSLMDEFRHFNFRFSPPEEA